MKKKSDRMTPFFKGSSVSFFHLAGFSLVFLFLFVLFFFFFLELRRISAQAITAWDEDYQADCAVVLTGGAGRIREGFDLLSRGSIRKLIISGTYSKAVLEDIFPQWPFYGNLEKKDVILEKLSKTTYENAKQTRKWVQTLKCEDLLLITSYLHMYRAKRVFRKLFPDNYSIYAVAVAPQSSRISAESYVIEVFKSLFYSFWYFFLKAEGEEEQYKGARTDK